MHALIIALFIVASLFINSPLLHAQQSNSTVSSDLSLDLNLAVQNPAPVQQQIVQAQTTQAEVVTKTGEKVAIVVKDAVPEEVKTQSSKDALNPDQSTSEQVVTTNVEEKNGTNKNLENQNLPSENFQNTIQGKILPVLLVALVPLMIVLLIIEAIQALK